MTVEYTIGNPRLAQDTVMLAGRPARIGCLVALAHRFEGLLRSGVVKDYAELARLGHVTRARVTQIMNLLSLAPEIQEYLLFLPAAPGRQITEREVRRIAAEVRWDRQRTMFGHMGKRTDGENSSNSPSLSHSQEVARLPTG